MQLKESAENYLEMILMLLEKKGFARSIDIADALSVTKPSVSHAMKLLRENGYIEMDGENYISLTPSGRAIAERIYGRHKAIASFLMSLGVDERTAFEDACKMEHDLSEASFEAMRAFDPTGDKV